jgi:hypothetical protein
MGALFGPKMKKEEPVKMPDPQGVEAQAAAEARRRQIASRSSRASTVMSRSGGEGGTGAYKNSLLGQAG